MGWGFGLVWALFFEFLVCGIGGFVGFGLADISGFSVGSAVSVVPCLGLGFNLRLNGPNRSIDFLNPKP